jgi:dolichol kinase
MTRNEVLRRVVHILIGLGAYLVPVIGVKAALVLALAAIPANAWLLPRLPGLRNVIRDDGSGTRAIWMYPLACALLLLVFHDTPRHAQAGWLALGVGDGLAPFLARVVRGPAWPWNARKRIAVSAAAAAIGAACALPVVPLPAAIGVAVAGMVADSLPLEDNLTWPLLTATAAWACDTTL